MAVQFIPGIFSVVRIGVFGMVRNFKYSLSLLNTVKNANFFAVVSVLSVAFFSTNIHAEASIETNWSAWGELLGGSSGAKIEGGKLILFNEKAYAVTADVIKKNGEVVSIVIPPNSSGPIETAVGIFDKPISTIGAYIDGSFGQAQVESEINPEDITSITYVAGRKDAQRYNAIYLATSAVQVVGEALKLGGTDKQLFDLIGEEAIKKLTSEEYTNRIISELSSGSDPKTFIAELAKDLLKQTAEEFVTKQAYLEILARSGISTKTASDFMLKQSPGFKTVQTLVVLENLGDWTVLLEGMVAFSNKTSVLRIDTVAITDSTNTNPSTGTGSTNQKQTDLSKLINGDVAKKITDGTTTTVHNEYTGRAGGLFNNGGAMDFNVMTRDRGGSPITFGESNPLVAESEQLSSATMTATVRGRTSANYGWKYEYIDWGEWSGQVVSNGQTMTGGTWVVGMNSYPMTLPRSGSATYNGDVMGKYAQYPSNASPVYGNLNGSVSLTANFGSQTINGNMNLLKENGSLFARTLFNASITTGKNEFVGTQQAVPGDSATINGGVRGNFYGPANLPSGATPPEAGGTFWVSGSNGTGAGVFRAKKQ